MGSSNFGTEQSTKHNGVKMLSTVPEQFPTSSLHFPSEPAGSSMHISVFDAVTLSVMFKVRLTEKAWPVLHVIVTLSPMTYDVLLLSTVILLDNCIA